MSKMPERLPGKFGGYQTQDALDICQNFLGWFIEFLKKTEPQAVNSIRQFENTLEELPLSVGDWNREEK